MAWLLQREEPGCLALMLRFVHVIGFLPSWGNTIRKSCLWSFSLKSLEDFQPQLTHSTRSLCWAELSGSIRSASKGYYWGVLPWGPGLSQTLVYCSYSRSLFAHLSEQFKLSMPTEWPGKDNTPRSITQLAQTPVRDGKECTSVYLCSLSG